MSSLPDLKQFIRSGNLTEALGAAKKLVAQSPLDPGARSDLCALLFASGETDRAINQCKAAAELGGNSLSPDFLQVLEAIEVRENVLTGAVSPNFPGECPAWVPELSTALQSFANGGDTTQLLALLESLSDELDGIDGRCGDLEFEGFRNVDARIALVLEGVFKGEYLWLPLSQLRQVIIPQKPELLQDLFFIPCMVTLKSGWRSQGHLLATYFGTEQSDSGPAKLAMETVWDENYDDLTIGAGQQVFWAGEEALPILSLGSISFS